MLQDESFLSVHGPTSPTNIRNDRQNDIHVPLPQENGFQTGTNERLEERNQQDAANRHQLRLHIDTLDGPISSNPLESDDLSIDHINPSFENRRPDTIGGNENLRNLVANSIEQSGSASFLEVTAASEETSLKRPYDPERDTLDSPEGQQNIPPDSGYTTPAESLVQTVNSACDNKGLLPETQKNDKEQKITSQEISSDHGK